MEKDMILPDKAYNVLKWLCMIALPAVTSFYLVLDQVFGWGLADKVGTISTALCALIGALIGVSSRNYNDEIERIVREYDK